MSGAKFNLPFNFGIPDAPPTNLPPELAGSMSEVFNAIQQLQYVLHTYLGIGQRLQEDWNVLGYAQTLHLFSPTRYYAEATEAITYGYAISLVDSGGALKVRNANATNNTRPCHGFCTTIGGIALGAFGEVVLFQGILTGLAGLTRGTRYFLSTANGLLTNVAPVAAGNIEQPVALAVATDTLIFNIGLDFIQH